MMDLYHFSIQVEAGRSQVQGQPGLQKTLSQNKTKQPGRKMTGTNHFKNVTIDTMGF